MDNKEAEVMKSLAMQLHGATQLLDKTMEMALAYQGLIEDLVEHADVGDVTKGYIAQCREQLELAKGVGERAKKDVEEIIGKVNLLVTLDKALKEGAKAH